MSEEGLWMLQQGKWSNAIVIWIYVNLVSAFQELCKLITLYYVMFFTNRGLPILFSWGHPSIKMKKYWRIQEEELWPVYELLFIKTCRYRESCPYIMDITILGKTVFILKWVHGLRDWILLLLQCQYKYSGEWYKTYHNIWIHAALLTWLQ